MQKDRMKLIPTSWLTPDGARQFALALREEMEQELRDKDEAERQQMADRSR